MSNSGSSLAPSVGVAVVVLKEGRILLGEDLGKGGDTVYGVPGGHWESGETLVEAASRETFEEAGVIIDCLRLISVHEFFRADKNKSYVTIGFVGYWREGVLSDESPQTRKNWKWFDVDRLPPHIFGPDEVLIENYIRGRVYAGDNPTYISSEV